MYRNQLNIQTTLSSLPTTSWTFVLNLLLLLLFLPLDLAKPFSFFSLRVNLRHTHLQSTFYLCTLSAFPPSSSIRILRLLKIRNHALSESLRGCLVGFVVDCRPCDSMGSVRPPQQWTCRILQGRDLV